MTTENSGQRQATLVDAGALKEQENAAKLCHSKTVELVENYRRELVCTYGVDIRYKKEALTSLRGLTEFSWAKKRDHHMVLLNSGLNEFCEPHVRAHELTHIAMTSDARKLNGYVPSFAVEVECNDDGSFSQQSLLNREILTSAFNRILDMAVEHRLRTSTAFKSLSAAQFISLSAHMTEQYNLVRGYRDFVASAPKERLAPAQLATASNAIDCANALFLDRMIGGCTNYFGCFAEGFGEESVTVLAEQICDCCQAQIPVLASGEECRLVDDVMGVAGLTGWYQWVSAYKK